VRKIRLNWCDSKEARAYVDSRQWESLADSATLFTHHRGNNVYLADVPPFGKVVVKESRLDKTFPFFERLGRELRFRLFDVNLRDARAALRAGELGVAAYHPLAVWRVRQGLWTACYIMYTYVEGDLLNDICKGGAFDKADRPVVKRHLRELGEMARRLHDGGLRHRDLIPANVMVRPDDSLAIIDFASGYPVRCHWHRFRLAQNLASFRRLAHLFDADCLAAFCEGYCGPDRGYDYEHALLLMLYWKYNGRKGRGGIHSLGFLSASVRAFFFEYRES
jgi:tRNA A-37 threonylcarbamoyl transferase component Bud32